MKKSILSQPTQMKWSRHVMALCPVLPQEFMYQLYGEWSVWHSNLKYFAGPNKIMINLYPSNQLEIAEKCHMGPFLYERKWRGRYEVSSPTCSLQEMTSIPLDFRPICSGDVIVDFHEKINSLVSIFGIGFDEVPIPIKSPFTPSLHMDLSIVGRDDIYLTVPNKELQYFLSRKIDTKGKTCYHLVRSVHKNQPQINVPFSTFVVTQILGSMFGMLLHEKMCYFYDTSM